MKDIQNLSYVELIKRKQLITKRIQWLNAFTSAEEDRSVEIELLQTEQNEISARIDTMVQEARQQLGVVKR